MNSNHTTPASFTQISTALSELGVAPGCEADFESSVKIAFRRLAKLHHPDRFGSDTLSAESKKNEALFKNAKKAYELLENEKLQGRWPPASPAMPKAFVFETFKPEPKTKASRTDASPRTPACTMEPSQARLLAHQFISSIALARKDELLRGRIKTCSVQIAREIVAFAKTPTGKKLALHGPYAKSGALAAIWSLPIPGLIAAFSNARPLLSKVGLGVWSDWINPACLHVDPPGASDSEKFDLPSSIADAAPRGKALPEHWAYYAEASVPTSPLSDPSILLCRQGRREPFMARLLRESPDAAEAFAPLCPPGAMATPAWLDKATQSKAAAAKLAGWFDEMPMDAILEAIGKISEQRRFEWTSALAGRLDAEARLDLHVPPASGLAQTQLNQQSLGLADLRRIELRCAIGSREDAASLAYDPSLGYAKAVFSKALAGDAEYALSLAQKARNDGHDPFVFMGTPLTAALGAKAWRDPSQRNLLLECLTHITPQLAQGSIGIPDQHGNTAASWIALCTTSCSFNLKA